jgi:hypothetical protein
MDFWIKLFVFNWVINILMVEFFAIRKLKKIIAVDEKRDSEFKAFRRMDTFWFSRPWLYLTCPFAINKIIFGFFMLFAFGCLQNIVVSLDGVEPLTKF